MSEFDRIEALDDGEQQREVYARYGLAMYQAQVFETGLTNLVVWVEQSDRMHFGALEVQRRYDELEAMTMGQLVRLLTRLNVASDEELVLCARAIAGRNRLAHRFWRENVADFLTTAGMQRLVDECDHLRALFKHADTLIESLTFRYGERWGLTPDRVADEAERMRSDAVGQHTRLGQTAAPLLRFSGVEGVPPTRRRLAPTSSGTRSTR